MEEKKYLESKVKRDYNNIDSGFVDKFYWKTQLDSSNRWRIYVSWNAKNDIIMPYDLPDSYDEYTSMSNDASFWFDGLDMPLWNYGEYEGVHKIGLDEFPYSELADEKYREDDPTKTHTEMQELAIKIIDYIKKYQVKKADIIQYNKEMNELDDQKQKLREKWESI